MRNTHSLRNNSQTASRLFLSVSFKMAAVGLFLLFASVSIKSDQCRFCQILYILKIYDSRKSRFFPTKGIVVYSSLRLIVFLNNSKYCLSSKTKKYSELDDRSRIALIRV